MMGEAASVWLTPGRSGKVLAAVNHAAYLLTDLGELVWLAGAGSPMHRRCVRWPVPLPHLAVETTFVVRDRSIDLASGMKLDLRSSEIWEVPAVPVQEVIELDILPYKLFAMVEEFLSQESPLGFGVFIRPVMQISRKEGGDPSFQPDDVLTRSAWKAVERIANACLHKDLPEILKEAEPLTGLGEGLTPAGDDFLGGLFFARHLLLCAFPNLFRMQLSRLHEWLDVNQPRTNLISFTLLKDNVAGHALEPLNRMGIALLTHQPVKNVISAASDLIKVGHSTGWNLLAGFVTGILMTYPD